MDGPSLVGGHFDLLADLLETERKAEIEENVKALQSLPLSAREELGRTVSRLTIEGAETGLGGYPVLVLSRAAKEGGLAPFHGMDQGDNVRVGFPPGTQPPFADGTLERVEEARAWVALRGEPPQPLPAGRCTVDLLGSDATYRRMRRALTDAAKLSGPRARLRQVLLGLATPGAAQEPQPEFFDRSLNEWQRLAVRRALAAEDVALVHGPPGTGKTTVLVEVIRQAAARGLRVLATAPSNVAVDNMLEKLLGTGLRATRMGHPARTLESLRHASLQAQVAADEQSAQVQELDAFRERMAKRLARSGRGGYRGEERYAAQRETRRLWKEARSLELAIGRRIVLSSQVVLSTHGGISRRLLSGRFDLVVLDEASQAPEPLSWIALLEAGKAVFAGDAMQLPPTLHSKEAAERGLALTLFERLKGSLPEDLQTMLRVQYRMNEAIMDFPSRAFYEGRLIADDSVKTHLASGLPGVAETALTGVPFVFADTAGRGWEEGFDELLQSRFNEGEAGLAARIAAELMEAGMSARDIGVIAPYSAQVRRLRALLGPRGPEVGSVDGFQGREKEAVVLSLVRSNERGEVGFLADVRRLNVAITRARRLLIVIGDSATLSRHPFYRRFLDHAQRAASWRSAWEWEA